MIGERVEGYQNPVDQGVVPFDLEAFGPFDLVIIQATSYCNLDCDYCYLPDRHIKNQFSLDLLEPIFTQIFASPFFRDDFAVCWHAGEPLAVPIQFYETAFARIHDLEQQLNTNPYQVSQSIQTNATLVNQAWCDLFQQFQVDVGVSLDGPAFIHDAHRKTRTGLGTHASTMRGISHLQKNNLDFHVIAVISQESLDYPDQMFNFFMDHGITNVGFNIEELEGVHHVSSLQRQGTEDRYRAFMQRFWQLIAESGGALKLREFERICNLIYGDARIDRSGLLTPFVILSIDCDGNFSTFDPELLAVQTEVYGDFILGNIQHDTLESVCQTDKFQRIYQDITTGWQQCRETCQYFGICGGGAASNKYWEHGTFRVAETMACKYYEQIVTDIVLAELEASLGLY